MNVNSTPNISHPPPCLSLKKYFVSLSFFNFCQFPTQYRKKIRFPYSLKEQPLNNKCIVNQRNFHKALFDGLLKSQDLLGDLQKVSF